jgi:hypothetical protein
VYRLQHVNSLASTAGNRWFKERIVESVTHLPRIGDGIEIDGEVYEVVWVCHRVQTCQGTLVGNILPMVRVK